MYYQGRIERRGHATHRNIEILVVTKIRFYAHADVTSRKVHKTWMRHTAYLSRRVEACSNGN